MNAADFFAQADELFASAFEGEFAERCYAIGRAKIRLRFRGDEVCARLTPALEHLSTSPITAADLTICAWDATTTAGRMIPPPWPETSYGARGKIEGFHNARFRTAFNQGSQTLSMIDRERRLALFWTRDASELPVYEIAAPFRTLFSWWAEDQGDFILHSAAIARTRSEGVLLAGAGGVGKSTTAFRCQRAGWNYLADDYCVISPGTRIFSLYKSAKLSYDGPMSVGSSAPGFGREGNKDVILINERLLLAADCRLLLLPRLTNRAQSSITPATPAEALRAIAPSSIFQLCDAGSQLFQRLAHLVRAVPLRRLGLGGDGEAIPSIIGQCLDSLGQ